MKKRIISAVVALILVVPLILLGGIYFEVGVLIIAALAFKEIVDLKKSHKPLPSVMIVLSLISILSLVVANNTSLSLYYGISYQQLAIITLLLIVPTIFYKKDKYSTKDAFYLLGIVLFLGLIFNMFVVVRLNGLGTFVYLITLPLLNDTFAYIFGSLLGKHKMCPSISPNKTWEGSAAGFLLGSMSGLIIYYLMVGNITVSIVIITLILSVVGQMGDLVMSKIKRENEIKDFSNLMPGHGGILDRIDSIIFVVFAYMFLIGML